ncbi:bifunctional DNA primase/polymerase [Methanobacterium formicicum]|uniref:DNA primase/polymerase bifunctional N-terminal domain-containing protein n=1 Tax=Methanobacterium formicicum TaxID=2162 RepID=A0A0S4FLT6_METFO|nr:bifunctional DNA primase/polymerase [Methanobacterium formicicum]CEL23995.1 hypothetical protein MB9_0347 [Methanobacterium formicicum]
MIKNSEILEEALNDENRIKNGLNIIFVTEEKHPGLNNWQKHAREEQYEDQIKRLWNKRGTNNVGYSYFTGVGGLIDIDFDWEWSYHLALRKFADRMETRTLKTPNGGYRSLFIVDNPDDFLDFKSKPPHVEIHGKDTHHVIVYGKAKDDQENLKEYEVVKDTDILKDNKILPEMIEFLKKINEECKFLEYKCIASKLKRKKNYLTQEQRTSIGAFFAAENIDIETATNFFRTCEDFNYELTKTHLSYLYEKEFKHHTCETLKKNFSWEGTCKGCIRKNGDSSRKNKDQNQAPEGVDISKIDGKNLFQITEKNGKFYSPKDVSTPIFEVNNEINFASALKPQICPDGIVQKTIGIYGSKSGYGLDPMSFNTEDFCALPDVNIHDVKQIKNDDQQRTIEKCIQEALKNSETVQKSPQTVLTKTPNADVGDVPNEICDKLKYYIKLEEPIQYFIISCWILGTYLFPNFATYGYLILSGEKGAGKGTVLDLLYKMCWNATKKQVAITEATLFRMIKEQLPTMLIDEYHRVEQNHGIGSSIVSIIESGYEKGGVVPRNQQINEPDGTKSYEIVEFPVYCPKAMATRGQVEADDKGIKIIIPKLFGDDRYAKRKKELLSDHFMDNIRERIIKWILINQQQIMVEYEEIKPTKDLNGREFNVWLAPMAICNVAFPDRSEEMLDFIGKAIFKNRDDLSEKETRVLTALAHMYQNKRLEDGGKKLRNPSYLVKNSEITNTLTELEGEGIHHGQIRSALDNLKMIGKREQGKYYIEKEKLIRKLYERGFRQVFAVAEHVEEDVLSQTYIIITKHENLDKNSFIELLMEIIPLNEQKLQEIYNYLIFEGFIEVSPDGYLEPSDLLRETVEQIYAKEKLDIVEKAVMKM